MVDDYLTTHGTNRARLKKLYEVLSTRANKPEAPAVISDDLVPLLRGLRDLFTQKIQTLERDLPTDHPVNMPFGLLGDLSIAQMHETTHTKMLAWLLDPSKLHGFGAALLCALINEAGVDIWEYIEIFYNRQLATHVSAIWHRLSSPSPTGGQPLEAIASTIARTHHP